LGALFPDLAAGADALLTNPPYARLGDSAERTRLAKRFASFSETAPTSSSNIYTTFVEMAWRLTRQDAGTASIVVPLSIAFHSGHQYRALRSAMTDQSGTWELGFFDRAPDALFGDDVKTRNAIATYRAGKRGLRVTGLLRWTSKTRRGFLRHLTSVEAPSNIESGIPKLATRAEAELFSTLKHRSGQLAHDVIRSTSVPPAAEVAEAWPDSVFVGPTAYNWFNCLRDLGPALSAGHDACGAFLALRFADKRMADAAYALIVSRLTLWLWRVEGDAFHVPRSFILGLPVRLGVFPDAAVDEISELGRQAWVRSTAQPIVAVNKGNRTVAFPAVDDGLVSPIDETIAKALDLSEQVAAVDLRAWYRTLVVVDDGDIRRNRMSRLQVASC
jgi:hypothetical protein